MNKSSFMELKEMQETKVRNFVMTKNDFINLCQEEHLQIYDVDLIIHPKLLKELNKIGNAYLESVE